MSELYKRVADATYNYHQTHHYYDFDEWAEAIIRAAHEMYPDYEIIMLDYDTDNDTYELDRQLDDVMDVAKNYEVIDYCNTWDDETIISTIVVKPK